MLEIIILFLWWPPISPMVKFHPGCNYCLKWKCWKGRKTQNDDPIFNCVQLHGVYIQQRWSMRPPSRYHLLRGGRTRYTLERDHLQSGALFWRSCKERKRFSYLGNLLAQRTPFRFPTRNAIYSRNYVYEPTQYQTNNTIVMRWHTTF